MKKILLLIFVLISSSVMNASSIDSAYIALQKNDRIKAREFLELSVKSKDTKLEASVLLILLNIMEERKSNLALLESIYDALPNKSAYLYPLWFSDAITDGYDKKEPERLEFLKKILNDKDVNGSIKAGLRYIMGMHYLFSNSVEESVKYWNEVGTIDNWQFVGLFDNTSGSGFNKDYGPLKHPEAGYEFVSNTNSAIKWFIPAHPQRDPWVSTTFHLFGKEGIAYAQTFINSEDAKEVIFALGGAGTFKVWLNDRQIFEEQIEQRTEMDVFKFKGKLNKGYNRILLQLGYSYDFYYPNFVLRIIDENGTPELYKSTAVVQQYKKDIATPVNKTIPHYAEEYFLSKINEKPNEILNYIMLSKAYFRRSMFNKAIETLEQYKKNNPTNILIEYELLMDNIQLGNRTESVKQLEYIRKIDSSLILLTTDDFSTHISEEDYEKAEKELGLIRNYYGENDVRYLIYQLRYDIAKKDYQTMVGTINNLYKFYPENSISNQYKFSLIKNVENNANKALNLLVDYLKSNFDHEILELLLNEFKNQGKPEEIEKILLKEIKDYPESYIFAQKLSTFYYLNKNYSEALKWNSYCLDNSPFNSSFWNDRAYIDEANGSKNDAIEDLKKAIHFDPNLFEPREKLRELQEKKPIISYLRNTNANGIIEKELKKQIPDSYNYEYIFDNKVIVLFQEGANITHYSYGIRLYNQKGIDEWKEVSINLNPYNQKLVIEQAVVIKNDGKKIAAERNENHIVFPSLEKGDIIMIEYRYENYVWGKLSKEFWDKVSFSSYVPVQNSSLSIYAPKEFDFKINTENIKTEPLKENSEEFICYKWVFDEVPAVKYEPYMPSLYNVGKTINISTVKSWANISNWYKDLVLSNLVDDYIVDKTYKEIFSNPQIKTDYDKALAIYNYILDNVKYSHVDFRQSNYVPQKPMITISTKLGDCKDFSLLYHILAKKAGLKTNLVLVNTKDTRKDLVLPSVDFNHCIIRVEISSKPVFIELTDEHLPFGSLSSNLYNSQALIIPNSDKEIYGASLVNIKNFEQKENAKIRKTKIEIVDDKISINTQQVLEGSMASITRDDYLGKTSDEIKDQVTNYYNDFYTKDLKIIDYSFDNLDGRNKPLIFNTKLEVENEVKSIGGLKIVKLLFFDEVVSLNNLPENERIFPILYWIYENNNYYENEIIVTLPENTKIVEKPTDFTIVDKFIDYQLVTKQVDDKTLKVTRKVKILDTNLSPEYYSTLRDVVKKILKAEDIYVVYK